MFVSQKKIRMAYNLFLENKRDQAFSLIKSIQPKCLYRYCSININTINSLQNGRLWMSNAYNQNDPYDCSVQKSMKLAYYHLNSVVIMLLSSLSDESILGRICYFLDDDKLSIFPISKQIVLFIELLRTLKKESRNCDLDLIEKGLISLEMNIIHQTLGDIRNTFVEELKMTCFSEDPKNILVWSHYSDSNTGICIEYPIDEIQSIANMDKAYLLPIVYTDDVFQNKNQSRYFYPDVMVKTTDWKYEHEWRLVKIFDANTIMQPRINRIIIGSKFDFVGRYGKENYELKCQLIEICRRKHIPVFHIKPQFYEKKLTDISISEY